MLPTLHFVLPSHWYVFIRSTRDWVGSGVGVGVGVGVAIVSGMSDIFIGVESILLILVTEYTSLLFGILSTIFWLCISRLPYTSFPSDVLALYTIHFSSNLFWFVIKLYADFLVFKSYVSATGVTSLTGVLIVSSAFIALVGTSSIEDDAFGFLPPVGFAPSNAQAV